VSIIITSPPKVTWEEPRRHSSRQRMNSAAVCATICAMSTADESNHSAAGTLHPHRTDRRTHDDAICRARVASRDKNTPNSNLVYICSKS